MLLLPDCHSWKALQVRPGLLIPGDVSRARGSEVDESCLSLDNNVAHAVCPNEIVYNNSGCSDRCPQVRDFLGFSDKGLRATTDSLVCFNRSRNIFVVFEAVPSMRDMTGRPPRRSNVVFCGELVFHTTLVMEQLLLLGSPETNTTS
jgi:hypothetical protein